MDLTPLRCLINSISRFIHLVTCRASSTIPAEKDYHSLVSLLKHLKLVLDDVTDVKASDDEVLSKACEELDIAVNESREFLEKWSPRMSKILCVLQSKPLVLKIQTSIVNLSCILCKLFESSPTSSSLSNARLCVHESQKLKLGQLSEHIEEILKCQKAGNIPDAEGLMKIIVSLNLRSTQELLNEYIALEKDKQKVEDSNIEDDLSQICQTLDLISCIRDYVVNLDKSKTVGGTQIPSYFRCPLSLDLMLDPVIVASGQTYERATIQKWLDHGLERCPVTGYKLAHKNLIPNYTVKDLITNWCNDYKVNLSSNPQIANTDEVPHHLELIGHDDDHHAFRSSFEVRHGFETQNICKEGHHVSRGETGKFDQPSTEHSYVHSRSESESSIVTSIDYVSTSEISSKHDVKSARATLLSDKIPGPSSSSLQDKSSMTMDEMVVNGGQSPSKASSFSPESEYNVLTSTSHVEKLILDLKSDSTSIQIAAAQELRFLAKYNTENRIIIGECGAIAPLIALLNTDSDLAQEHAVTALLNLSINEKIKTCIAEEGALDPLIHVIKSGNMGAKENAAAAIFSISLLDEYRIKVGRSGAVKPLVDLLGSGTIRGKKDAATALFNLSIFHENKARIVQAGAVKHLVRLLDPTTDMVDKAVALLANLSTIPEGCTTIAREGGIPLLVEILDTGSQRGKENAASVLLQLCITSSKYCRSVLQEGAVPSLVALSQSGTPRAKEKAQQLLSHFRNQRESAAARGRS